MAQEQLYTIEEYLESLKTPAGGYTKATLDTLDVSWPPKKGWKQEIIDKYYIRLARQK